VDLGQALVISMLVIALIGVLIVFTSDAIREANAQSQSETASKPVQWLNLSGTDAINQDLNWVNQIRAHLPRDDIELTNLATPGATAGQLAQLLYASDADAEVDVATLWVGPEDFLAGIQILEFEENLNAILSWLNSKQATILVGNLPDLTAELVAAKLADLNAVRPVIDQWNASIARLATSHGATLVELDQSLDPTRTPIRYLYLTRYEPNLEAQTFVADQFLAVLSIALGQTNSGR
jgi:GDSL-like Lipase/Acylhydrolase family